MNSADSHFEEGCLSFPQSPEGFLSSTSTSTNLSPQSYTALLTGRIPFISPLFFDALVSLNYSLCNQKQCCEEDMEHELVTILQAWIIVARATTSQCTCHTSHEDTEEACSSTLECENILKCCVWMGFWENTSFVYLYKCPEAFSIQQTGHVNLQMNQTRLYTSFMPEAHFFWWGWTLQSSLRGEPWGHYKPVY